MSPTAKEIPTITITIVGTAGSGKSTIVRQMKFVHEGDFAFTQMELDNFREILIYNYLKGFQEFVKAVKSVVKDKDLLEEIKKFEKLHTDDIAVLRPTIEPMRALFKIKDVVTWRKNNPIEMERFDREWNLQYVEKEADRILKEGCVANEMDILHVRQRTTGLSTNVFTTKKPRANWKVIDMGGQSTERRKWKFGFKEANAVIFVAALNEFDHYKEEDSYETMMEKSIELFKEVIDEQPKDKTIILFLNKSDLFKLKMKKFKKRFPKYKGGDDSTKAMEFVTKMYLKSLKTARSVRVHHICALDRKLIETAWSAVTQNVWNAGLSSSGLA